MRSYLPMFNDDFFGGSALDQFFDDFAAPAGGMRVPKVDIEEMKDHYEIKIEAKKDESKETKDEERHFLRKERVSSAFRRQFAIKGVKKEDIKADLKDGILTISLPKVEQEIEKAPYHIQIG